MAKVRLEIPPEKVMIHRDVQDDTPVSSSRE